MTVLPGHRCRHQGVICNAAPSFLHDGDIPPLQSPPAARSRGVCSDGTLYTSLYVSMTLTLVSLHEIKMWDVNVGLLY